MKTPVLAPLPPMPSFAERLIAWHARHGRHDLPWQQTTDPYRVWLSEIMLQQTQVATVTGYYARFIERFRTLPELAAAPVEEVMKHWSGLGYYARARNLHACARAVMRDHGGEFPRAPAEIARLPGIGQSTANAIAVFCFGARVPILDGNVRRLLCRCFGIAGHPGTAAVENALWQKASELLPAEQAGTYIQAQMDMGATVCTRSRPRCPVCPLADLCVARRENRIAELPTPRPRKALPERAVTLLVLRRGDQILLEVRPPAGIWGGLLSLPELPESPEAVGVIDVVNYCAHRFGMRVGAVSPAPTLTHTFTHFRLHIHPLLGTVAGCTGAMEPHLRWVRLSELAQAALPAPIRTILSAIP